MLGGDDYPEVLHGFGVCDYIWKRPGNAAMDWRHFGLQWYVI